MNKKRKPQGIRMRNLNCYCFSWSNYVGFNLQIFPSNMVYSYVININICIYINISAIYISMFYYAFFHAMWSILRFNFNGAFWGKDCLIFFSFSACVLRCSRLLPIYFSFRKVKWQSELSGKASGKAGLYSWPVPSLVMKGAAPKLSNL